MENESDEQWFSKEKRYLIYATQSHIPGIVPAFDIDPLWKISHRGIGYVIDFEYFQQNTYLMQKMDMNATKFFFLLKNKDPIIIESYIFQFLVIFFSFIFPPIFSHSFTFLFVCSMYCFHYISYSLFQTNTCMHNTNKKATMAPLLDFANKHKFAWSDMKASNILLKDNQFFLSDPMIQIYRPENITFSGSYYHVKTTLIHFFLFFNFIFLCPSLTFFFFLPFFRHAWQQKQPYKCHTHTTHKYRQILLSSKAYTSHIYLLHCFDALTHTHW